ncbi:glycosyltransferase family 2 protein [Candidatus Margulisiibacteriota bacterium]
MPKQVYVSVIIPVYNGKDCIQRAIKSVLAQTYKHFEIIVIDDGSIDNTSDQVKIFPEVKLIQQKNLGASKARNVGIELAQGKYIAFLDADDEWLPYKLDIQTIYLDDHPDIGFILAYQKILLEKNINKPGWLKNEHLDKPQIGYLPGTMIVRKEIFRKVGLFNTNFSCSDDSEWFFRAKDAGILMKILPQVLLKRYIHKNNMGYKVEANHKALLEIVRKSIQRKKTKDEKTNT